MIFSYTVGRYHIDWNNLYLGFIVQLIKTFATFSFLLIYIISFTLRSSILDSLGSYIILTTLFFSFLITSLHTYIGSTLFRKRRRYLILTYRKNKDLLESILSEISFDYEYETFYINNSFNIKLPLVPKNTIVLMLNSKSYPEEIKQQIITYRRGGISVYNLLNWVELYYQRLPIELLESDNAIIDDFQFNRDRFQYRLKRFGDLSLSLILIVSTSPILIISCIFIFFEDGLPVFYSQSRKGLHGSSFKLWKIRTMVKNAESIGPKWTKYNDSRITRVGSIIRRLRIDELPQLFSVLQGCMSLIGPRPEIADTHLQLSQDINHYSLRNLVLPGISGWAQVNKPYTGSNLNDSKVKLSYDLYYLRNFSFWLDVLILCKTLRLIFLFNDERRKSL